MARMACALLVALAGAGFAQQQSPPGGAPRTIRDSQTGREPSENLTTSEVQQLIQDGFNSEPILANARVGVRTDDHAIVLMGSVGSEKQYEAVLRIAQSFTGGRQIVDKIKISRSD